MHRQSKNLAVAATVAALSVSVAVASAETTAPVGPGTPLTQEAAPPAPAPATPAPAPAPPAEAAPQSDAPETSEEAVRQGATLAPPPSPKPTTPKQSPNGSGGTAPAPEPESEAEAAPEGSAPAPSEGVTPPALDPSSLLTVPSLPDASCSAAGVPAALIPIYQRASDTYGLGPQGPAILAAINEIETAFGTNTNVSYAGAEGWMQFMPETWAAYGVDANGDGVKDPYNPEDAIFAAANYLKASGMPEEVYDAIWAYNHADWYVQDVLAKAGCYSSIGSAGSFSLAPKLTTMRCQPAEPFRKDIPAAYMRAFEAAAGRYELGERGVWTLAAIARLESNFGRGMSKEQLRRHGPLGLDGIEWRKYSVDGNEDGRMRHASPADSAATLARLIWSRGGIEAGVFTHNQAQWYVDAVSREARRLEGACETSTVEWAIALPGETALEINWDNLVLSNELELYDIQNGLLDARVMALLALMTQHHEITISSLRSDHSMMTASGNVSNHYYGRAIDIAAVDGVSCTETAPTAPCAQLGFALAQIQPPALRPPELIYCFDLDGIGPAFALPDHCDHIHAGFDD